MIALREVELRLGERNKEGRLFRCNGRALWSLFESIRGYVDENGGQEEVFQHCSPVVDRRKSIRKGISKASLFDSFHLIPIETYLYL